MKQFNDRIEAGQQLALLLKEFKDRQDVVVLGIPRGGVVVAFEIAQKLNLPLDIIIARKIGAPGGQELAVGALTSDGQMVLNEPLMNQLDLNVADIADIIQEEKNEAIRRLQVYRGNRSDLDLINTTALLVDDGMATGATMRAAIKSAHKYGAKKVIVAVPMASTDVIQQVGKEADQVVCLVTNDRFWAIGQFYKVFEPVEDEEVITLLDTSRRP